jgi:hypothetical protein
LHPEIALLPKRFYNTLPSQNDLVAIVRSQVVA